MFRVKKFLLSVITAKYAEIILYHFLSKIILLVCMQTNHASCELHKWYDIICNWALICSSLDILGVKKIILCQKLRVWTFINILHGVIKIPLSATLYVVTLRRYYCDYTQMGKKIKICFYIPGQLLIQHSNHDHMWAIMSSLGLCSENS